MLLRTAPMPSSAASRRRSSPLPPVRQRCTRGQNSATTVVDYGDDDDFRHYCARVEFAPGSGPLSALRLEVRGGEGGGAKAPAPPSPAAVVVLTAAPSGSPVAFLTAASAGAPSSLVLEDDGAWPMERSCRRAFALSAGGAGDGGDGAWFFVGFSAAAASGASALTLRASARGFEVAVSSAPGWHPGNSADFSWDAAARMKRHEAPAATDPAAQAARSLVLRPPAPSAAGWRCFAAAVPVVVDVKLSGRKRVLMSGTMTLERRREWGKSGGGGNNKAPPPPPHPVAAAARRRRAMMRALSSPPWLESPWGLLLECC